MKKLALGLMSGTSLDGLSLALGTFLEEKKSYQLVAYQTVPYPRDIQHDLQQCIHLTVPEISRLNFKIGKFYAVTAQSFLKNNKIPTKNIAVIGTHGQTIFHEPEGNPRNTLQIGEPSFLAQGTGIPVVSDFRPRAIAAGEEGAPLVPYFDHFFYGKGPVRAFQNIGGIGNVTVVGKGLSQPLYFDTGPGNCLIDWAMLKITGGRESFDNNGKFASKGNIRMDLVEKMAQHPYFNKRPPKSTGRELFNENFILSRYKKLIQHSPADFIATLTYFTAYTISQSYKKFVLPSYTIKEVVISGGGEKNKTLLRYLGELLSPIPVCSYEKFGIPAQAKEPLAFAFFALRAVEGKENHKGLILGKVTPQG